ncbi:hypothetical protein [Undibacterium sp.]|uniref:hypothetical protein n=1 Tax=Undibacterium sp. TaxID=1914977 RepID=UPI00374DA2E4
MIDWDPIELEFCGGMKSVSTIAAEYGVSTSGINKKAKRENWQRDGSAPATGRTLAKLNATVLSLVPAIAIQRGSATTSVSIPARLLENGTQSDNEVQGDIVLAQRRDIRRSRALVMALLQELEQQTGSVETLAGLSELMEAADDKARDKRNELFQKVISHANRTSTLKSLVDSLRLLVALEREAFGIDVKQKTGKTIEDWLEVVSDA